MLAEILATANADNFVALIRHLQQLDGAQAHAQLLEAEQRLQREWPVGLVRSIPLELRGEATERMTELPLYRLTHPIDLSLVPFESEKWGRAVKHVSEELAESHLDFYEPEDWPLVDWIEVGDDGLEHQPYPLHVIHACLEREYGLVPRRLVLSPGEFASLHDKSRPQDEHLESRVWFHHGDLVVSGDITRAESEDWTYYAITGDVEIDGDLRPQPNMVFWGTGGDVTCKRFEMTSDARCLIEGMLRADIASVGDGGGDWSCVVDRVACRVALFFGEVLRTDASDLTLDFSAYSTIELAEQIKAAVDNQTFKALVQAGAILPARPEVNRVDALANTFAELLKAAIGHGR